MIYVDQRFGVISDSKTKFPTEIVAQLMFQKPELYLGFNNMYQVGK